jgi:hypothetical protein
MEPAHPANKAADNASDPSAIDRNRLRRLMMVGFILHLSGCGRPVLVQLHRLGEHVQKLRAVLTM